MSGTAFGALGFFDWAALALFVIAVLFLQIRIEKCSDANPSTSRLMSRYRRAWMNESPRRANRMVDSALMVSQRNGAAFFASGCMIAIGGLAALLGQADRLIDVAQDMVGVAEVSRQLLELKLLFLLIVMVDAFLKFVWAHRIMGYCGVLLGAMPEDGTPDEVARSVDRAAKLNITGGRSFNRGLRGVYFSLAALGWFAGPIVFIGCTLFTVAVIYRREFLSDTRAALL